MATTGTTIKMKIGSLCLAASLLWLSACATNPVTGRQDFVLMSESDEISLGQRYNKQIAKQQPTYPDKALNDYVNRIGQQLAVVSHRSKLKFEFKVVDSTDVNAFALPGGFIYITRGLLAYLNSEAELAAVLGHEIGHVTARHSVRQHSASTATGVLGAVVTAATGVRGSQDLFNLMGGALLSGYGRKHELESDRLGAQYLVKAGYDPRAIIEVIGVLKNQELFETQRAKEEGREPRSYHGVFASHPSNDQRLQEVVAEAGKLPANKSAKTRREIFLRQIDGMTFGSGERDGIVRGNRFFHKPLDFGLTFPDQWSIDNQSDKLVATAPGKDAILQLELKPVTRGVSPHQLLESLGLRNISNGRSLKISTFQAYTVTAPVSINNATRTARFVVIYDRDNAFIFTGAHKINRDLGKFDDTIISIAKSYHKLSAQEQRQANSQRIEIITAGRSSSIASLARQSPISKHAAEQLRLLNDLYPAGEIQSGQRVKVVR